MGEQRHSYDYWIDGQGQWVCEGNAVTDPQLFRLLSRSLFAADGGYFVRCEGEVHPVRIADAPLWVRYVHVTADAGEELTAVDIELEDGRREPLDAATLWTVGESALYCLSTPRRLKTRLGKVAYYELTRYLQIDGAGCFYFTIAGKRYNLRSEETSR